VGQLTDLVDNLDSKERERLLRRLHEPEAMDYKGATILLRRSARKIDLRLKSVAKEPWTVEWIETFGPGDVFYDIGANVGAYSLIAAVAGGGDVQVVAAEPSAPSYHDLCVNIALNELDEVITPLPVALWSDTTVVRFAHYSLEPGTSKNGIAREEFAKRKPELSQRQLALSLDDAIRLFGLPAPTRVKIDTDGAEENVLRGAQTTLASGSVRSILLEGRPDRDTSPTDELLAPHGFAVVETWQRKPPTSCSYHLYERA
jgi:FkbM family methyltransferase